MKRDFFLAPSAMGEEATNGLEDDIGEYQVDQDRSKTEPAASRVMVTVNATRLMSQQSHHVQATYGIAQLSLYPDS